MNKISSYPMSGDCRGKIKYMMQWWLPRKVCRWHCGSCDLLCPRTGPKEKFSAFYRVSEGEGMY